jgi:DnaJ homolog subfamily C member 13
LFFRQGTLGAGCEMLSKMYEPCPAPLVAQAIEGKLPQFLLELLKSGLDNVENSAAVKAQLVKALKAMTR